MTTHPLSIHGVRWLVALLLSLALAAGCTVEYVAERDRAVEEELLRLATEVDRFWVELLDTPAEERGYAAFRDDYNRIESDLRALVLRNEIRPLNAASTEQAELLVAQWQDSRELHRDDDTYGEFRAKRHRDQFARMFRAMARGEQAKQGGDD